MTKAGGCFLAVIESDYQNDHNDHWYRLWDTEESARSYIEREHARRWDYDKDEFKQGLSFEDAAVYRVMSDGRCRLLQRYTTVVNEHLARCQDGGAEGWIDPTQRAKLYGDRKEADE